MNATGTPKLTVRERFFRSPFPLMISDLFAVTAAYYITLLLRFYYPPGKQVFAWINVTMGFRENAEVGGLLENFYYFNAPRILFLLGATLILLYAYLNLYATRQLIRRRNVHWTIIVANLIALGIFYIYFYLTRNEFHPRSVFATLLAINVITTLLGRTAIRGTLNQSGLATCKVLLIGVGPETEFIDRYITTTGVAGLRIVARLPAIHPLSPDCFPSSIEHLVKMHRTHMLICADKQLTVSEIMQMLELAETLGQEVKILSDKLNVLINEADVPSDFVMELPLVHFALSPSGTSSSHFRTACFGATPFTDSASACYHRPID